MGGFSAILTCLSVSLCIPLIFRIADSVALTEQNLSYSKFGSPKDTKLPVDVSFRPEITGVRHSAFAFQKPTVLIPGPSVPQGVFLCPMLAISPESRPPYIIELIARGLASIAPALPLADANKGKNSEDPEVEEEFLADPMTYHGKLRIATGLGCLKVRLGMRSSHRSGL